MTRHSSVQEVSQELQASLRERLRALHIQQQQLQQTAQALAASTKGDAGRSRAAWQLTQQQASVVHTARLFKQEAQALQGIRQANTARLQYDQAAANKVLHCMRLEQRARQLDSLVGTRPYNRLHPRYTLE